MQPSPIKIGKKIVGVSLAKPQEAPAPVVETPQPVTITAPPLLRERPDALRGMTYKIKPFEHAYYITINDIMMVDPDGKTHYEPFEVFINSKNTTDKHWIAATTRMISALFRRGGDIGFIMDELSVIGDNEGGYYGNREDTRGLRFKSIVHEVGYVIEQHIKALKDPAEYSVRRNTAGIVPAVPHIAAPAEGVKGERCPSCREYAVVKRDGCPTCLNCGDGKCGG